ncbi:MAG: hypothetical protein N0E58_05510 [Candidatus Thiodiazotropha endolucinida]|uniref:Leucine-rich repeat domain-containing protein n=1 Tax=Candidatus Thiodiazotropha taylori TaxID=2792791 RepID=A0A9E4NIE4_9GAMM|nr:hypothetical protein [Candidatus Thiodiazotropha taylori]MCW4235705.1 hypothetical protein [Candidatus Thiodiazotropha endolucinida]
MPIDRVGKFIETEDLGITHSLGIESDKLKACIKEITKRNIKGVFGCPVFGFKEDNFDFMRDIPSILQIWFWEINLKDIEGIYALKNLKYFGVSEKRPKIDFSQLPKLETVVWHPIRNDGGIESLSKLIRLDLWRFKSKNKSYTDLKLPENIEKLDLNWCNPTSLDELPIMNNLKELQIHYCRNLESINAINKIAPNLKRLVVTRSANLEKYQSIQEKEWEHLYINIKGKTVANKSFSRTLDSAG